MSVMSDISHPVTSDYSGGKSNVSWWRITLIIGIGSCPIFADISDPTPF